MIDVFVSVVCMFDTFVLQVFSILLGMFCGGVVRPKWAGNPTRSLAPYIRFLVFPNHILACRCSWYCFWHV